MITYFITGTHIEGLLNIALVEDISSIPTLVQMGHVVSKQVK